MKMIVVCFDSAGTSNKAVLTVTQATNGPRQLTNIFFKSPVMQISLSELQDLMYDIESAVAKESMVEKTPGLVPIQTEKGVVKPGKGVLGFKAFVEGMFERIKGGLAPEERARAEKALGLVDELLETGKKK